MTSKFQSLLFHLFVLNLSFGTCWRIISSETDDEPPPSNTCLIGELRLYRTRLQTGLVVNIPLPGVLTVSVSRPAGSVTERPTARLVMTRLPSSAPMFLAQGTMAMSPSVVSPANQTGGVCRPPGFVTVWRTAVTAVTRTRRTARIAGKRLKAALTKRPSSFVVTGNVSRPPGTAMVTWTARTGVTSRPPVKSGCVQMAGEPALTGSVCWTTGSVTVRKIATTPVMRRAVLR